MTRFFSHLSLTADGGGLLEPFAEELPEPVAGEPRRLSVRVLFFVDRPGVLRQFASLVTELAARGHDVHLALRSEPDEDQQPQVERLVGASPTSPRVRRRRARRATAGGRSRGRFGRSATSRATRSRATRTRRRCAPA